LIPKSVTLNYFKRRNNRRPSRA